MSEIPPVNDACEHCQEKRSAWESSLDAECARDCDRAVKFDARLSDAEKAELKVLYDAFSARKAEILKAK